MNFLRIFLISFIFSSSQISASELDIALSAYEEGNYSVAYELFTQLAQAKNAEAQYNLGFMYFGGEGIPQNDTKAAYWFEQAAKLAHASAQDTLAYLYLNGRGIKTDKIQAFAWYSVAAENGIFLAKNICEDLLNHMDTAERNQANLLSSEYIKKYKRNNL